MSDIGVRISRICCCNGSLLLKKEKQYNFKFDLIIKMKKIDIR